MTVPTEVGSGPELRSGQASEEDWPARSLRTQQRAYLPLPVAKRSRPEGRTDSSPLRERSKSMFHP